VFVSASVAVTAAPAAAATVTVSTTSDVVDPADGVISLREAITEASAAGEATIIELAAAGTYSLTLCGAEEDANAAGDLDYVGTQPLSLLGHGSTVSQTCADERVLDQLDGAPSITVDDLTITGGDHFDGAAVRFNGDVQLTGVTVANNNAGTGAILNSGESGSGSSVALVNSSVGPNTGTGIRVSFGGISVTGSTIAQNTGRGIGAIDGALSISDSSVNQNGQGGVSTTGQGDGTLTFVDSVASGNGGPGVACSACGDLVVTRSAITGNVPSGTTTGGGIAWSVDQDAPGDARTATITDSTIADNVRTGPGGGLFVGIVELSDDPPPAQILLIASTFSGNSATGAEGRGGAVHALTVERPAGSDQRVEVSLSTVPADDDAGRAIIGIIPEERITGFDLPIDVAIDSGQVGGPSGGLAFTLSVIDVLTPGELGRDHKVAVTGTMALDGTVGPVGGTAQKAVAVRNAGYEVFLVPPEELEEVKAAVGDDLRVIAVDTLAAALEALASLGGPQVP